jgi:hypothetical protein
MPSTLGLRTLLPTAAYGMEATMPIRNVNPVNESLSSGHATYGSALPAATAGPANDTADLSGIAGEHRQRDL